MSEKTLPTQTEQVGRKARGERKPNNNSKQEPFVKKKLPVYIKTHEKEVFEAYKGYGLNFEIIQTPVRHEHQHLAAQRAVAEAFILYDLIKRGSKVHDVGGSPRRHERYRARSGIHCSTPLLSSKDCLRNPEIRKEGPITNCRCRAEDCRCQAGTDVYLAVHSLYYFDPDTIARLIGNKDLLAVLHKFPTDVNAGTFAKGEAAWERVGSDVVMSVTGQLGKYTHPDMAWLTTSNCEHAVNGGTLAWEIEKTIGDTIVVRFAMTPVAKAAPPPENPLRLYNPDFTISLPVGVVTSVAGIVGVQLTHNSKPLPLDQRFLSWAGRQIASKERTKAAFSTLVASCRLHFSDKKMRSDQIPEAIYPYLVAVAAFQINHKVELEFERGMWDAIEENEKEANIKIDTRYSPFSRLNPFNNGALKNGPGPNDVVVNEEAKKTEAQFDVLEFDVAPVIAPKDPTIPDFGIRPDAAVIKSVCIDINPGMDYNARFHQIRPYEAEARTSTKTARLIFAGPTITADDKASYETSIAADLHRQLKPTVNFVPPAIRYQAQKYAAVANKLMRRPGTVRTTTKISKKVNKPDNALDFSYEMSIETDSGLQEATANGFDEEDGYVASLGAPNSSWFKTTGEMLNLADQIRSSDGFGAAKIEIMKSARVSVQRMGAKRGYLTPDKWIAEQVAPELRPKYLEAYAALEKQGGLRVKDFEAGLFIKSELLGKRKPRNIITCDPKLNCITGPPLVTFTKMMKEAFNPDKQQAFTYASGYDNKSIGYFVERAFAHFEALGFRGEAIGFMDNDFTQYESTKNIILADAWIENLRGSLKHDDKWRFHSVSAAVALMSHPARDQMNNKIDMGVQQRSGGMDTSTGNSTSDIHATRAMMANRYVGDKGRDPETFYRSLILGDDNFTIYVKAKFDITVEKVNKAYGRYGLEAKARIFNDINTAEFCSRFFVRATDGTYFSVPKLGRYLSKRGIIRRANLLDEPAYLASFIKSERANYSEVPVIREYAGLVERYLAELKAPRAKDVAKYDTLYEKEHAYTLGKAAIPAEYQADIRAAICRRYSMSEADLVAMEEHIRAAKAPCQFTGKMYDNLMAIDN